MKSINQNTNTQVTFVGALMAVIVMWLIGHFAPELMAVAPAGLETAIGGVIVFLLGLVTPHDAAIIGTIPDLDE